MRFIGRMMCLTLCLAAIFAANNVSAQAQDLGVFGWGVRGGLSLDPDQIVVGVQVDLGSLTEHLYLRPNLEFGFGDDATVITLNGALHYQFQKKWDNWSPYAGGEIGINYIEVELPSGFDVDDTEPALNGVFGIDSETQSGDRLFFEGKIGITEEPDFKVLVGWMF